MPHLHKRSLRKFWMSVSASIKRYVNSSELLPLVVITNNVTISARENKVSAAQATLKIQVSRLLSLAITAMITSYTLESILRRS